MRITPKGIALSGTIAALYAALTIALAPVSYGPVQVRIAEALTVLPFLTPWAVLGLYFGCMAANIFGGYGLLDIFGGSFITLLAAVGTYGLRRLNKAWLAPLPPVILNAFGVSIYLHLLAEWPYLLCVLYVGIGELLSCYAIGYPLLLTLRKVLAAPQK